MTVPAAGAPAQFGGEAGLDPWLPEPLRILRIARETADTFTLHFDVKERARPFEPGQFNMLYLFGVGEVAISISGDPGEPESLVHTIRAVGTVTTAMKALKRDGALGVRGPYGRGWPMREAAGKDVLIVAGGLGIAPLRPVIYHLMRHRSDFGTVTILAGARSPSDLVYRKEMDRWQRRADATVRTTVDHAGRDWTGPVGVVTALLDRVPIDAQRTIAMICGPEVMMRFTARALAGRGVPAERMFLSLERNMRCAIRFCGHCQYREWFLCKDGPVFRLDRIEPLLAIREV
jgi:NAD(P)H-flavin reductase